MRYIHETAKFDIRLDIYGIVTNKTPDVVLETMRKLIIIEFTIT